MAEDTTTTTVEPELDSTMSEPSGFGSGDVATDEDQRKPWLALVENDGKLPEEKPATETAPEVTEKPEGEGDKPAGEEEAIDPRLAKMEADGAAEIEAARQEQARRTEVERVKAEPPPAQTKPVAEVKPAEMPETFVFQGKERKIDEVIDELWDPVDSSAGKAQKEFMLALADAVASKRLEAAGFVRPDAIAPIQERIAHQEAVLQHKMAVLEVAALNPEIIAIDARRPGSQNPHPFWAFIEKQSAGIKHRVLETGAASDIADAISAFQDMEKRKAEAVGKKAASKGRKDALYESGPSNTSGKAAVTRQMTDEEFDALPERDKQRMFRQEAERLK